MRDSVIICDDPELRALIEAIEVMGSRLTPIPDSSLLAPSIPTSLLRIPTAENPSMPDDVKNQLPFTIERLQPEHWHERRQQNIGSSEVAALFGVPPDEDEQSPTERPAYLLGPWALWQEKSGKTRPHAVHTERAAWGLRLESAIAEAGAEIVGGKLIKGGYVQHARVRGMACTLDYLLQREDDVLVFECKNVDRSIHYRSWTEGEPPFHVLLQLQHQLACTGLPRGVIVELVGGNQPITYHYDANPSIIAAIERRVTEFWESIERKEPPPVDGTRATAQILAGLYPPSDLLDQSVDLTGDNALPEACAAWLDAKAIIKTQEGRLRLATNIIAEKMGPHRRGLATGFTINATAVAEKAPTPITADMVGTNIPGRKGYRFHTVRAT